MINIVVPVVVFVVYMPGVLLAAIHFYVLIRHFESRVLFCFQKECFSKSTKANLRGMLNEDLSKFLGSGVKQA